MSEVGRAFVDQIRGGPGTLQGTRRSSQVRAGEVMTHRSKKKKKPVVPGPVLVSAAVWPAGAGGRDLMATGCGTNAVDGINPHGGTIGGVVSFPPRAGWERARAARRIQRGSGWAPSRGLLDSPPRGNRTAIDPPPPWRRHPDRAAGRNHGRRPPIGSRSRYTWTCRTWPVPLRASIALGAHDEPGRLVQTARGCPPRVRTASALVTVDPSPVRWSSAGRVRHAARPGV